MVAIYRPAGRRLVLGVTAPACATTKDKFKVLRWAPAQVSRLLVVA